MTTDLGKSIAQCLQSDPNASVEVLVDRLKSDDRLIQINTGNALASQTFVTDGGIANVGILTSCTRIIFQAELGLTSSPEKRVGLVFAQFPAITDVQQSEALTVRA